MRISLILMAALIMSSCIEQLSLTESNVTMISYSFHDSSVPPPYHRSYDINISPNELHITVNSYGDILADETIELEQSDFSNLIKTINDARLVSGRIESELRCTGGTSESLNIFENNAEVYSGYFDHCGGTKIPESSGNVKQVIQTIKNLVPNLEEMLK